MRSSPMLSLVRLALMSAIGGLLLMGTFAKRGWMDLQRIAQKNAELDSKIRVLRLQKDRDDRQIEAFENRAAAQERLIRQVLGYVRPNETVIEFE